MDNEDYVIPIQGQAICQALDKAISMLDTIELDKEEFESVRDECKSDLFRTIVQVAIISCGQDEWSAVYNFLIQTGINVPADLHLKMSHFDSMSDVHIQES